MTTTSAPAPSTVPATVPTDAEQPLLVELFTSQGCHSCPSADRVLSQLGDRGLGALDEGRTRSIIPLAFHIDYWNYIGWTDPYSSERWTERQRAYARKLSNGRVYTPQLVIHGRAETVGSRGARIVAAIDRIGENLSVPSELRVKAELSANGESFVVLISVAASLPEVRPTGRLEAWVALYQNRVRTQVPRGENAGKTLYNDHVVLEMQRAFQVPSASTDSAAAGSRTGGQVRLRLPETTSLRVRDMGVVAFLQNPETLAIHGVATATIADN